MLNVAAKPFISGRRISLVAVAAISAPLSAAPQNSTILIPTGSVGQAISSVARQAKVSVGYVGRLPKVQIERSHAQTPREALAVIAHQAGLTLIQIDARHFRLEQNIAPVKPIAPVEDLDRGIAHEPDRDIIVTATKRDENLFDLPLSVSVVTSNSALQSNGLADTSEVVANVSSLTSTNMGPGRNRIFIRGVADSAFNGPSQSTVGIFLGEARINFDAPDPDLKLIDIDRVEILKGPQGELYGSGVLGGVYRVVPNLPNDQAYSVKATAQIGATAHGGMNATASGVANLPLAPDLAVRAVAYRDHASGWIDDSYRAAYNVNRVTTTGGRLSSRWRAGDVTADAILAGQSMRAHDSQYAAGEASAYARATHFAEPHGTGIFSGQIRISAPLGELQALFASAYVHHDIENKFDATDAASRLGEASPLLYSETRGQYLVSNEARLADQHGSFQWLFGVNQLSTTSHLNGILTSTLRQTAVSTYRKSYQEYAAFGDASLAFTHDLLIQGGLRVFRALNEENKQQIGDVEQNSVWRANPSAALSWKPDDDTRVWINYSTATRPGGLNPSATEEPFTFAADRLVSMEAGLRIKRFERKLTIEASIFRFNWRDIQSDILLGSGLIGTINVGRAHNMGGEFVSRWTDSHWLAEVTATMQFGEVYSTTPALGTIEDARLPTIPRLRGHARIEADLPTAIGGGRGGISLLASGPSHLSFDPRLDQKTNSYALMGAYVRREWQGMVIALTCDNLLNSAADSFAFGNSFSVQSTRQHTPVRPRTLTFSLERKF